jgi:hypothetical protein
MSSLAGCRLRAHCRVTSCWNTNITIRYQSPIEPIQPRLYGLYGFCDLAEVFLLGNRYRVAAQVEAAMPLRPGAPECPLKETDAIRRKYLSE